MNVWLCVAVAGISAEPLGQSSNKVEIVQLSRHPKDTRSVITVFPRVEIEGAHKVADQLPIA